MKKFKFFTAHRSPLTAFLIFCNLLLTLNLIVSCQRDPVEKAVDKPDTNLAAVDRACPAGYCEFFFMSDEDASVQICGDIFPNSGFCNYGCNPAADLSYPMLLQANVPYKICVLESSSVCILNATTAYTIHVTVNFGNSTPVTDSIPTTQNRCFNTNADCSLTAYGC